MALDIAGIVIISLFFLRGFFKGIIVAAFSVIAILLGILVSLKLSQSFATWLLDNGINLGGWSPVISYILLFIGVVLFVRLIGKLLQKAVEGMMLGVVNKLAGGLVYAFLGIVIWSSLVWFGTQLHVITPELIAASKTYGFFFQFAPWFFGIAGNLIPYVKDTFGNLQHFFDNINSHR